MLKHILPALGKLTLREITAEQVQDLIYKKMKDGWERNGKREDFAAQTLRHIVAVIKVLFNQAEAIGWFDGRNPAKGVQLPEMVPKRERVALTHEQFAKLYKALPSPAREMVFLLVMVGLRISELTGLRWRWVNLEEEPVLVDGDTVPAWTIGVRQNYIRATRYEAGEAYGQYQTLKGRKGQNGSSRRNFTLAAPVVEMLRKMKAESRWNGPDDPVFAAPKLKTRPKPIDAHNYLARHLKPTAFKIGLPPVSWHDLRHTANTWAEQAGASISARKAMFGWSEDRMAIHYGHADMTEMRAVTEAIAGDVLKAMEKAEADQVQKQAAEEARKDESRPSEPPQASPPRGWIELPGGRWRKRLARKLAG